jgi:hypothetical protein
MSDANWKPITDSEPPKGVPVLTRINDARGARNEAILTRGGENGRLWFVVGGSMYVYYAPTEFRPLPPDEAAARV